MFPVIANQLLYEEWDQVAIELALLRKNVNPDQ
jgi:hypothetical protein